MVFDFGIPDLGFGSVLAPPLSPSHTLTPRSSARVFGCLTGLFSAMILLLHHILFGRGELPKVTEGCLHLWGWHKAESSLCLNEGDSDRIPFSQR